MAEIAVLVEAVFADKSPADLHRRLRSDSSLKLGFEKLYLILKDGVQVDSNGKLGFELWDLSQIQAVASIGYAIYSSVNSVSVEQVEPIIVAVVQQLVEFALCGLEKSITNGDGLNFQDNMIQMLEMALLDGMDKEFELIQPCPLKALVDSLAMLPVKSGNAKLLDYSKCLLQEGGNCTKQEKQVDRLLLTLASDNMQLEKATFGQGISSNIVRHEFNKVVSLTQHWALFHLGCVQRLVMFCKEVLLLSDIVDDKTVQYNLRKRLSCLTRIFKLLGSVTKDVLYVEYDSVLFQAVASVLSVLPNLFKPGFEFISNSASVESSVDSLIISVLQEFLQFVHVIFCNSNVFRNIQAFLVASVLDNLDAEVWRYNKSSGIPMPPLSYFPQIVTYVLKLIGDINQQNYQDFELGNLHADGGEVLISKQTESFSCQIHSEKFFLLKKYSVQELMSIIFPISKQWLDNLMHLAFFLHSEGVKLKSKLEAAHSSGTKVSSIPEPENALCHEDEALFGDLFSEGGRSVGSVDGHDQPSGGPIAVSSICNMPLQAATEVFSFLKIYVFSPRWHPSLYEDGCRKLMDGHVDILLSIINCQACFSEDRMSNNDAAVTGQRNITQINELCFELLHNFLASHLLSDILEEYLVMKILSADNGCFVYNDQSLALVAHALISKVGSDGSQLRSDIQKVFVDFIFEKIKTVCLGSPEIKEVIESLPSVFHIEVLLMTFHLSSEDEKARAANYILSSLREINALPSGFSTVQLSCWGLLVSRLILILRHMIYYPRACPATLLSELRFKLRDAASFGSHHCVDGDRSPWASVAVETMIATFINEGRVDRSFLEQLIDVGPLPAAICRDDKAVDYLGLKWTEICSTFAWILEFWKAEKAATVEDLIIERYVFVLCWDIPSVDFKLEHMNPFWADFQNPEATNVEHLLHYSHSTLCHPGDFHKTINISDVVLALLQHIDSVQVSDDIRDLSWDFFRHGSWLALLLSLLNTGISRYHNTTGSEVQMLEEHTPRDAEFLIFAESLVSSVFGTDRVGTLVKLLSSLLERFLQVYEKAFILTFDGNHKFADACLTLLFHKHAGIDKPVQDALVEKCELNFSDLESVYQLLSKVTNNIDKTAPGIRTKAYWELLLHGFPCHTQTSSGTLLSCILNIRIIVSVLAGLFKIKNAREVIFADTGLLRRILNSVFNIKFDKTFEPIYGKCDTIYDSLGEGLEGFDYSSFYVMHDVENLLRKVNGRELMDSSVYECLITKAIDTMNNIGKDHSKNGLFKFLLSAEDASEQIMDLCSRSVDLFVLIDSLDKCNSDASNVKVLNFFAELLSGEVSLNLKHKLQQRFASMDLLCLSRWIESRLLGSTTEPTTGVTGFIGISPSLREATRNFIACLLSPSLEMQSQELHHHFFEALLVSLDSAFLQFDVNTAKSYLGFVAQLSRSEIAMKSLLQKTVALMEKMAGEERLLQGLKFLFDFVGTILSDCGSNKNSVEKSSRKSLSSNSSGVGSVASRSLATRKNSETLLFSANQEGNSTSIDCDATSVDEDEDDGTSDGDVGSMDKDDEEDSNSEKTLASKVCTFTSSGSNFMEQHWYFCYTCDLTVSKGCCSVCAKVCHRGHRVVYSRSSRFFCDCGAGGVRGSSCQCLKPRKFTGTNSEPSHGGSNFQSFMPFQEDGDQLPDSDSDVDDDILVDMDNSVKLNISREVQDGIPQLLEDLNVEDRLLKIFNSLLPSVTSRRDSNISQDKKVALGTDKVLSYNGDLLQLKKAYKSGSLDLKIKADYSNAKELKTHLASGSLVKSLLSVSTRGRLAVGEGDKVAIFDVGQLIGQATIAPVTADKANVKPLSKNVVRFEIVHLVFNPLVENYLAVVGYEECQVLTVSHRGEVADRLAIELALQGAYIRRVDWVPGSQVHLMVVTNRFVKIYDLSQDNISPLHYITISDGSIVDATLVLATQGRLLLVVLSEAGCLFRLEITMKGNVGARPLKETIDLQERDIKAGGSSLYYSSTFKLLFVSYQDGTTLIGRLDPDTTSLSEISYVYEEQEGKLRAAGLHRWKELLSSTGLFVCFSSMKSNSALTISLGENDVFAQNMRQAVGSTSPVVGLTAYRPLSKDKIHCLVLHDDGSLQIYSHVPVGVDSAATAVSDKVKKLGPGILNNKVYGSSKPEFPLDFFEKTMCITADVKLSGDAIRNGDSEGAKQSLASEDGFLESPSPAGFKVTISNSNPDIVMVGVRVHVGNTSANHIPSDISIFQRVIKLDEGMRSWYDIPFTVAESLLADEEFTVCMGPTFNRSALPRIDSFEVYGRAKDEFGWKEKMDAVLDMEARVLGINSWVAGSGKKSRDAQSASVQEQVVADGLKLLSRFYSLCRPPMGCLGVEEGKPELGKLRCKQLLETIFESDREPLLQAAACRVLQTVFPQKEVYYQVKDTMRLFGVVKSTTMLSSRLGVGGPTTGWIIEEFTTQMRAVSKIALHRRSNFAAFLDMNGSEVVDGLMQVLWGILDVEQPETQAMNNIVISSVELIYCYAECLALHGKEAGLQSVAPAVSLFKKLLFSPNEAVQTSSSLAISSRLLQVPFPKQTMLHADDAVEGAAPVAVRSDAASAGAGNTQILVEEDSITSSVQYCCDGCSTVPILRRRWHCNICPDFDLCEACYEVLDIDRLPPPHSREHPMSAIPIEAETYGTEGNEIHFSANDASDTTLLPVAPNSSMQNSAPSIHVLEPNLSGDFSASMVDAVTISASKRAVNSLLLSELLEQLKGWMETTSGVQAIPIMQLFYRLSSAIGGPFVDDTKSDSLDMEKLIKWFLNEINTSSPFAAKSRSSFGEVTILVFMFFTLMLRNWHQPGSDGPKSSGGTDTHDKNPSPTPNSASIVTPSTLSDQEKSGFLAHLLRACGCLRQQTFINYLMDILQQLVHVFKSPAISYDASHGPGTGSGCGALLTVRRELPAGNFSPFFSDSYAKSHRADIFADYHRLLLENAFRLVYSLVRPEKHDKVVDKEKLQKIPSGKDLKLEGYQDVLCSYINNPHTTFVRRYARRLFLHLCGSKTQYYSIRDSWQFSSEVKKLYKHIHKSGGFQSARSYERSVKIVKCLSTMAEVAAARPRNWQKYCLRHEDILSFLLNGVFYFREECVVQTLKLLNLAFYTGKDGHVLHKAEGGDAGTGANKLGSQPLDSKKKKKGEDGTDSGSDKSYVDVEPLVDVFTNKTGDLLRQFIDYFLLEWNLSSVRAEAKCVLHGVWHHARQSLKETVLLALLQKVQSLPMYGQNITEYTELVTFLLGTFPDSSEKQKRLDIVDRCLTFDVIKCIFETLHSQNELLANHPNSRIYNTLSGLVEFDGYYLESEPCVACSSPEVPYSRMKLESLKSETKFTDNRIIVKCTGSYTIQSVTMNVHDARKSKSVKVLNLYYNNRPVADLSELKNNWALWKRAKICHLAFNQTELKVDFPIPITACNFMIELDSFYENLQALSLEPLQCPRCSRPVTDRHGICSNCHENAYQCRQCRNINYENLDSFLCNECGYSKYGRFEFNFMAKPSFTFDNMENDEDMKRGLAAIESESENAHRRYQQLLGFKKPLLKIVSSVGEIEMDSQQKDSVQQMMVSLPGPSCKINRKIALLGVLYGEKCKAAFDSVSKSVQTLQGLRRVLMNYLHQKHSDTTVASRFVVSRSPNSCYGCASVFVTQCLELLQVLSKHLNSKKQLVAAGILSELFENNIHQGPRSARVQARAALCAFSEGDINAVNDLNSLIQKKVIYCLEHHRSMDIAVATREELLLLSEVCSVPDEFWEARLRVVFQILFSSIKLGAKHPAISEHVILPCLRIISQACTPPKPETLDTEQAAVKTTSVPQDERNSNLSGSLSSIVSGSKSASELDKNLDGSHKAQDIQLLSYSEWEKGASYLDFVRRQYKVSQAVKGVQRSRPQRYDYLALKYALRWKRHSCKTGKSEATSFELGAWVTELVLSACSQSIRSEMCMLISLLSSQSSSRRFRLLNLLMSLLPATLAAGENAAEYFELLSRMIESEDARLFLTVRGYLTTICKLITQEVGNIESLERSLHIDISQGFILHKLIELLGKFLDVTNIRSRFMREQLLSEILEALIVIRGLIVQKTKLISDCNRLLKDLLDSLLLESSENKRQFIQACINGLQIHGQDKRGRTSLFILEQLCNLICPSKPESVYLLILNKAHTQEEFIRGSMTKNPYASSEIGPLMRDVKNKICNQLDLLGLVGDDYGMELLVAGNIISLDLSVAQVYEQVWKKSTSQSLNAVSGTLSSNGTSTKDCPPMTVTYRLQGLDGEATEPMIKELDEDREESQDPEVEFAIAGAVRECGGLEILLAMIQLLRDDLKSNQEQLVVVFNLLMYCCKIRENRRSLLRLGALGLLLETARRAFSLDAMEPAEGILLIVESLTLEANESDNIDITQNALTVSTEETGSGEEAKKIVLMFLERLCHPLGLKKTNKQQRNTEMVARILPYLTYGERAAMEALVQYFDPYLQNWSEFDRLQKQHQDNAKDESISQQAAKQRFAIENFVRVSESLKTSSCGERLKDIILEKGITGVAVRHLRETFAYTGQAGFRSSNQCALGLKLPSVPLVLSMLRGLSMGHLATQSCIDEGEILPLLHALEGVSGENEIGAKAENLLDTLSDKEGKGDGFLADKISGLRNATKDEMRRRALRKREQLLQGLGWRQELASDGGERIVIDQPVLEGLEDVEEEEDGLACMVCREGYSLRPMDLLGVYTYSKRVNLGVGTSGSARGDCVYTTVSHFNIIHYQCHQEAKRADAALRAPKKEWEGAALRNNETLCNNLFPLRGTSVPVTQYMRYIDQYWDYLNALGRADGSRLRLLTYDIVLMLARFATGASFSTDSRGGGKESNSKFLPFMIQMARHLLDHDDSQRRTLAKYITAYLSSSTSDAKSSPSSVSPSIGTEETVQFMMVSSLLSESYESWLEHRRTFLQRGIYHAYMQRSHNRPTQRSSNLPSVVRPDSGSKGGSVTETDGTNELLSVIQPMLVYTGLIEQLQCFFKIKKSSTSVKVRVEGQTKDLDVGGETASAEGWEILMKERLLNVKEMLGFSKDLLSWLDDMTSITDLQEAFDVIGVLPDVLSGGFSRCEDFVYAAIDSGKS
ncbi:auxin transport protein BIG isoform X1 [Daucus carota subsp. sativus]|uniref:auxin transport protein BIG isoform X1 n=1 Tax=Daucus carota subsp. sativus TaxID=79200 RepID=UPI0007EFA380|nr:PREDICTED: auxin transport protein BIG isoform X1 [Daucus carota subsp. sativus]